MQECYRVWYILRDLGVVARKCSVKSVFLNRKVHRKTTVPESLFPQSCRPIRKETPAHMFFREFCEIFYSTYFV